MNERILVVMLLFAAQLAAAEEKTIVVNEALLAGLPRITAKVQPHGTTAAVEFEGVSLGAALSKSGVP